MESFATGLKRIHDACREAGVKVEFYGDEYGFTVRFYRHCGEEWGKASDSKTPKHQSDKVNVALNVALNDALRSILGKRTITTTLLFITTVFCVFTRTAGWQQTACRRLSKIRKSMFLSPRSELTFLAKVIFLSLEKIT